jgi:zinc/manganese transport system permease protein
VRRWDFVFYASFGVVVTSSVRLAGVLLVFAYLVVPATAAAMLARSVRARLALGWALGALVSVGGLAASWAWDLPTGATVVVAFGVVLAAIGLGLAARAPRCRDRPVRGGGARRAPADRPLVARRARGGRARRPHAVPGRRRARDVPRQRRRRAAQRRRARSRSRDRARGAVGHPANVGRDAGAARQYLAGRAELLADDRMVIQALRARARERHRWWVGLPLLVGGASVALALARRGRAT